MARKKQGIYGLDTLKRVQSAWKAYQDQTGATQAQAAKALGMGTSGFNQYLRGREHGGMALNTDFLIKFAALVGKQPSELDPGLSDMPVSLRPTTITLQVLLTLAGRKPKDRSVMVDAVGVTSADSFAVEVDIDSVYPRGSVLIVMRSGASTCAGDMVIIDRDGEAPIFGQLNHDDHAGAWWVAQVISGATRAYDLQPGDVPLRVSGVHYPKTTNKMFV